MVLLSLTPQIHLWIVRGGEWNGAYVSPFGDEPLYAAYVNALVEGRTRKNDPFGGKDDSASSPLPESIFSIQFVPAYLIAMPARAFGLSVSKAFIIVTGVAALLASLSVFWLLNCLAGDHRLAAAGTFFVLCLGRLVGKYGLFGTVVDIAFPALPFLRRYQPAVAFPLFFVFQLLVWRALTGESKRRSVMAFVAGLTLAILIFCYLYLWTAAAAWLACIGLLWFYLRPLERRKTLALLTMIGALTAIALVPYARLLSQRAIAGDADLILASTHNPDLLRIHEILGGAILVALALGVLRRRFEPGEPVVVFVASLALLPFVVFNQQVLTGKTMQVFHFENYVVNYSTVLGLLMLITLFWKPVPRRLLIWMAGLSFAWGVIAIGLPSRFFFVPGAIVNDKRIPVLRRLKELSEGDGTFAGLTTSREATTLVFSPSVRLVDQLPSWTSQGTLLDPTGPYCSRQTREEQKEFFYMHLYFSKVPSEALGEALRDPRDGSAEELAGARNAIFGYARTSAFLTSQFKPIQEDEVQSEVRAYQTYVDSFTRERVLRRPITYAVIPDDISLDFSNLDRWYERDSGERVGAQILYRLRLRN